MWWDRVLAAGCSRLSGSPAVAVVTRHRKFLNHSVCTVSRTWRVDMNFDNGTVDSIRSKSQRGLAAYWARLALTKQGLPPFDQFAPGPGVHDPKHIAVWKVESNGGQLDFRALYRGSFIDEAVEDAWVRLPRWPRQPCESRSSKPPSTVPAAGAPFTPCFEPPTAPDRPLISSVCCCRSAKTVAFE